MQGDEFYYLSDDSDIDQYKEDDHRNKFEYDKLVFMEIQIQNASLPPAHPRTHTSSSSSSDNNLNNYSFSRSFKDEASSATFLR